MKKYSIAIASNFLNHYQNALSIELCKICESFYYIVSEELQIHYKKLGFADLNDNEYVIKAYKNPELAEKIICECDVVITGSYAYNEHILKRDKLGKPIFYYSERLFKDNNSLFKMLRYVKYWLKYHNDNKAPLLCVSAYAAGDYNEIGLFKNRAFKWGYFPKEKKYEIDNLIIKKKHNSIFWAGRFVEWKHPDIAVKVAKKLNEEGYDFEMNIAGTGEMSDYLSNYIEKNTLENHVHLLGSMSPEKVREYMEESEIYLFTSDKGEGWGVVLLEAMNSGCAVVANEDAGSTRFLISDNENGFIYNNNSFQQLYQIVKRLLDDNQLKKQISIKAYETIINEWNPTVAATRLYEFIDHYLNNKEYKPFDKNILSVANSNLQN